MCAAVALWLYYTRVDDVDAIVHDVSNVLDKRPNAAFRPRHNAEKPDPISYVTSTAKITYLRTYLLMSCITTIISIRAVGKKEVPPGRIVTPALSLALEIVVDKAKFLLHRLNG
eukprot:scaffold2941_cov146-Skeletonema_marinoi.AAC.6